MNKDILIVGGGISGIYSAIEASNKTSNILLVESERELGGLLRKLKGCELIFDSNKTSSTEYLRTLVDKVNKTGIEIWKESYVSNILKEDTLFSVDIITKDGIKNVKTKSIIIASGFHEKTRNQSFIPGSNPSGIFTSSAILYYVNVLGYLPTKTCVFYGSTDLSLYAIESLIKANVNVIGVFDDRENPSCLNKNTEDKLNKYNIPLYLSYTVTDVIGKDRVEAIEFSKIKNGILDENEKIRIDCDSLIISQGYIPECKLIESLNAKMSLWTKGPIVDQNSMTSIDGIFTTGNSLMAHNEIETQIINAKEVGINAAKFKQTERELIDVDFDENYSFVVPEVVDLSSNLSNINFFFRPAKSFNNKTVKVYLNKQIIFSKDYTVLYPPKMENITLDLKKYDLTSDSKIMLKIE